MSTVLRVFLKDPEAELDYQINWATWLGGDTISTSSWVVPAGIAKTAESNSSSTATIWLANGNEGDYEIVNRIVTAAGRTEDASFVIQVRQ